MHRNFKFANIFFLFGSIFLVLIILILSYNKTEQQNSEQQIMIPYNKIIQEYGK
jgi:hypothetical protein